MEPDKPAAHTEIIAQCFTANLAAVLKVGGKQRASGSPGPVSLNGVWKRTSVARSTLSALKSSRTDGSHANPDLSTICRIADDLGIPPAFLLMRPEDWATLAQAVSDAPDYITAASKVRTESQRHRAWSPLDLILREMKVHPDSRPKGVGASPEVDRANARDEWRRRSCHKLTALMLRRIEPGPIWEILAAIGGALVARTTPHTPKNHG
jgi:transcriptional regulator with XRE-family HTH domain